MRVCGGIGGGIDMFIRERQIDRRIETIIWPLTFALPLCLCSRSLNTLSLSTYERLCLVNKHGNESILIIVMLVNESNLITLSLIRDMFVVYVRLYTSL